MSAYSREFDEKEFNSEPVYDKKYLKTWIKSYKGEINTNFHKNKIPEDDFQWICLSVILIDSVFRTGNNYYPQVFLEECKYVVKKRISKYIIDDIEISSDSDRENSDEKNSDKEIKKNKLTFKHIRKTNKNVFWKTFFLYMKITK